MFLRDKEMCSDVGKDGLNKVFLWTYFPSQRIKTQIYSVRVSVTLWGPEQLISCGMRIINLLGQIQNAATPPATE